RRLMNQNPEVDTFFRFTPRFWFEADKAQRFHAELRPFVRVQSPQGGFETLDGQALFTLTPDMLIKAVQDKTLEVLGRGNIEDNRKIDEEQLIELHRNFAEYLEETGFAGSDLTRALMDPNSALPWPKKPFICYTSAMNEEGVLELSPVIWLPQEMHKKSGIQTRLLLSIPMAMSFNDLLNYAQNNEMLRDSLQLLLTNNAEMIPQINRLALTYREDNGLGDDDELPLAGPIAFNGNIEADSFMTFNTGTVMNHADVTCQDAVLMSLGGSVVMSSLVARENRGNGNFQDRILAQARLHAGNLIKMFAKQDIVFQGAETISEVSTHILALADILDIPAVLVSQRTEQLSGKYSGTETWVHVHNHVSRHISGGELTNEAGGKQDLHGSHYSADFLNILANDDIEISDVTDHMSHTFTGEKSGGFKTKKRSESSQRQTSRSSVFESRKAPTNIESYTGNLGLTAPHFTGGHGATLNAPLGEVMIRLGRESFEKTSSSTMTSSTWNKMVQKSEKHLTFSVPSSDGPVKIKALKAIVETIQGKELELLKHLEIIDGELITRALAELHEYDETVVESLGGPAAAVIAIAVSCLTAGAAGPVLIGALGQVLGSAFAAGFASLASQAAVSLISNQGDLSKVVKDITSSQALRSLATSMVTAGLVAGATDLLNGVTSAGEGTASATTQGMAQSSTQGATQSTASLGNAVKATSKAFDIGERIQAGLIRASSETLVNSTIGGQDFEESVLAAARSGIANIAGGFFAHEWGLEYKDVDSQIDYFTHKLIHGIIGAGMGAISDGEALAGSIGGVVGEVVGEAYADTHPEGFDPTHEDFDPSLRESLKNRGEILTQVSAALAAAFLGETPNVAACTAFNAVHENAFADHGINRQSCQQTGEVVSELLDMSEGNSADTGENSVKSLAEGLEKGLADSSLVLTPEQYEAAAENILGHIRRADGDVKSLDMNTVVLQSLLAAVEPDGARWGRGGGETLGSVLSDNPRTREELGNLGQALGSSTLDATILGFRELAKRAVKEISKTVVKEVAKKRSEGNDEKRNEGNC
ncbi:MAG: DUF637 domain-containing protein, partial [Alphaproteobacteria bacterium]|nr:DUF637 domain-containing protein [Alphaproteobacteria bacterium]